MFSSRSEEDPSYTPLCDIDESVSCSVAFNSTYGKGFGFIDKIVGQSKRKLKIEKTNPQMSFSQIFKDVLLVIPPRF